MRRRVVELVGRGPSACGCRPSTRPACASCAPTPPASATGRLTVYDDTDSDASSSGHRRAGPRRQALPGPPGRRGHRPGQVRADRPGGFDTGPRPRTTPSPSASPRSTPSTSPGWWRPTRWTSTTCSWWPSPCCAAAPTWPRATERFTHVLVDEYQDTNRLRTSWCSSWPGHGNVTVVGTRTSRSTVGGADIRNILQFEEASRRPPRWSSSRTTVDPDHLGRGQRVIGHNCPPAKHLFTEGETGDPIRRFRPKTSGTSAWVAGEIIRCARSSS